MPSQKSILPPSWDTTYTLRIATIKITENISENVDKLETSHIAGENTTEQTLENSLAILQQVKHRITM